MKIKISFILLALGIVCASAYAAHAEETALPVANDINMTAPHQSGTWSFAAEAVWLQPINQAFSYAILQAQTDEAAGMTADDKYKDVNPGYHGWFGADITYAFPGNGRDVTLAYEGLQGNDTEHIAATETAADFIISIPYGYGYDTAKGEIETRYDAADLVFGQKLDVGERIRLHPFMGLRYAYINSKDIATYTGPDPVEGLSEVDQYTWNSSFNGIGPRFGSDAEINLGRGFSVRARLGLSALIGSANPDLKELFQVYANDDDTVIFSGNYSNRHASSRHLVPEMDGRLGLNYSYHFDSNMALGVEAGWQATNYFNAIYQLAAENGGLTGTVSSTNFGLQGPYARLQVDIA